MEIIVGTVTVKNNKILMVKEAKKEIYGKWAFPAGHLDVNETLFEGAKRETLEETGCNVEIKKAFPILTNNFKDKGIMLFHFLAEPIEETGKYDQNEIIETKWIDIDEMKQMKAEEFRSHTIVESILANLKNKDLYELGMIKEFKL